MDPLHVVILAAGQGTRMRSDLPKVLLPVLGVPMVAHVVRAATALDPASITLVVSPDHEQLRDVLAAHRVSFAVQDPPRGTGDAAAVGLRAAAGDEGPTKGRVLIINGDTPAVRAETLRGLVDAARDAAGTFLTVEADDPTGSGRVIREADGGLLRIVEEADANADELAIREVNAGLYVFDATALAAALAALTPDNRQAELYLTDTLSILSDRGESVCTHRHGDPREVHGVNTRAELLAVEEVLRVRKLHELANSGVGVLAPATARVDTDVRVGEGTVVYPGVILEGSTRVGRGCVLHANVRVTDSEIDDGVVALDGSIVESSRVGEGASLGPYARLRPGADIGRRAKVGNFVEVKNARLGHGSKASHLTYLGDAEIGDGVNIGAGTITCNYDGAAKHRTVIGDGVFIGSNTALVAPVEIGAGAYVGAGSTITKDVPAGALAVGRGRQVIKEGWAARRAASRNDASPDDDSDDA